MGLTLLLIVTDIFGGIKIIVACFAYINIHTYIYMYIYIYTHITLYTHNTHMGFLCSSVGKESAYNAGDLGSIPGLGRCSGEGNGNPL